MFTKLVDILTHLVNPLIFMFLSSLFLPGTIFSLLRKGEISTLFSPSAFKDAWFARFWAVYGPLTCKEETPNAKPLIETAYGTVMEIGPGSGEWVHLFNKHRVKKIYGVEPNKDHHESLRKKIKEAGLSDIYVIVPVGVEDLGEKWVGREEVDCVVTIQCLCSVPSPKAMISSLYTYIKPCGLWIVYEHVVTHRGGWVEKYQSLVDIIWPTFLGGCSITRDTEKWLREVGSWSKVDLVQPPWEPYYEVLPHIMGVLKK